MALGTHRQRENGRHEGALVVVGHLLERGIEHADELVDHALRHLALHALQELVALRVVLVLPQTHIHIKRRVTSARAVRKHGAVIAVTIYKQARAPDNEWHEQTSPLITAHTDCTYARVWAPSDETVTIISSLRAAHLMDDAIKHHLRHLTVAEWVYMGIYMYIGCRVLADQLLLIAQEGI